MGGLAYGLSAHLLDAIQIILHETWQLTLQIIVRFWMHIGMFSTAQTKKNPECWFTCSRHSFPV